MPDIPAPESTIQFDCATCALFITTGAMNMDMSVLSSELESTAGSGSRTGVNSKVILGPWVRAVPDDSVVSTVLYVHVHNVHIYIYPELSFFHFLKYYRRP